MVSKSFYRSEQNDNDEMHTACVLFDDSLL